MELDKAAECYADGRDERMAMTKREVDLQNDLLKLMHKHKKTEYICGNVEIHVVPEREKAKVKIHKEEEADQFE